MTKHAHNHSCTCDHSDLRFCKTCRVVHCLGCNAEWVTRTQGYWHNTYPGYWNYTLGGNSYLGNTLKFSDTSVPSDPSFSAQSAAAAAPSPPQSQTCTHKG